MDLSIVIPMFNEADNVETTIRRIEDALSSYKGSYEIVPVNDGSTDNTLEMLNLISSHNERVRFVSYPTNFGRGQALRAGFEASRGQLIVSIDADLSYDPRYILRLIEALDKYEDADFVLASQWPLGSPGRFHHGAQ